MCRGNRNDFYSTTRLVVDWGIYTRIFWLGRDPHVHEKPPTLCTTFRTFGLVESHACFAKWYEFCESHDLRRACANGQAQSGTNVTIAHALNQNWLMISSGNLAIYFALESLTSEVSYVSHWGL